jgi:hypothetical protein
MVKVVGCNMEFTLIRAQSCNDCGVAAVWHVHKLDRNPGSRIENLGELTVPDWCHETLSSLAEHLIVREIVVHHSSMDDEGCSRMVGVLQLESSCGSSSKEYTSCIWHVDAEIEVV